MSEKEKEKVLGFKINPEFHDKVKAMIEHAAGGSNKEWLEKAVALMEVQSIKEGSSDFKPDLTELEIHTTRMYEIIANMVQRANYIKDDAVKGLEVKLESRDLTIGELQGKVKDFKERITAAEEALKQSTNEQTELNEQLEGLRSINANNQDLISQYKEKVDTLSSLVNEYKGYATENEELKQSHANQLTELKERHSVVVDEMKKKFEVQENRMVSQITEQNITLRDQEAMIEKLQKEIETMKVNNENQLTRLTDRKELEKERAILEIERKYQAKLESAHEQYNNKVTELYERLEKVNVRKGAVKKEEK